MTDVQYEPPSVNGEHSAADRRRMCRFDPAHGIFSGPATLVRHYEQEHAADYKPSPGRRRVTCAACGGNLAYAVMREHALRLHKRSDWQRLVRGEGEDTPAPGTPAIGHERAAQLDALPYGVQKNLKRRCLLCGAVIARKNMPRHFGDFHPPRSRWQESSVWADAQPDTQPAGQQLQLDAAPKPAHRPKAHKLNGVGVELDSIVIGTIEALAYPHGVVPVVHLPALFAWRDHTADMLRAVSGDTADTQP